MRILRFFFLLRFYCGSVGFLLLLSTWRVTTFDSLGFSPGRCRPVNGPSSAAVNSRQSHTAAHWLPAPAGGSLHRISPSSSTYILLHISLFRRQLHQRCHYKWQLLIVSWAIDPVVVSSITQCFILVGFCALSRSVAEFITGVRYLYYAAISASRSHIRISLSRVSPGPRAFALLRLHLKGPPKTLAATTFTRPAQLPPSHFGFLVALPLVRVKDPPSCALPPLLLHLTPSASATSSPHLANFLSSRRGSFTCDAPPSGLRDLLRFQYQLRR